MKFRTFISALCLLVLSGFAWADGLELNPNHPRQYTVAPRDTLWDIASKFLANPWQWPEIWRENPHIANPHWIYPGDELVLDYNDGGPHVQVARRNRTEIGYAPSRPDEVKLVPTIRVESLEQAIPTIPLHVLQPFLMQTKVVSAGEMESAPYVIDFADEHIAGGTGDRVYVRGLPASRVSGYMVFRSGKPYKDAETEEILGYEALYVADVQFQRDGDPSTMLITKSNREARIGDRILPVAYEQLQMNFIPHPAPQNLSGHIISVVDGVSQIGQYDIVVIDRGTADGIEIGHVLEILRSGQERIYRYATNAEETFNLPGEKEGFVMVFHPYPRVSFGLVMNATRSIHLRDAVKSPL